MAQAKKATMFYRRQPINQRVIYALMPCLLGGIYFFGWRSLAMVVWAGVIGFVTELLFARRRGEPATEAVFVTTTIFALIMPPAVPWHVLTFGVLFAIFFAKEVFGGFGRNIFNPAMAGRCFVYVCFPIALTGTWTPADTENWWGALDRWTTAAEPDGTEAVTGASPLGNLKAGKLVLAPSEKPGSLDYIPFDVPEGQIREVSRFELIKSLAIGNISGTMGVTSAVLIVLGGMYLFLTKTASRVTILTLIITYAVLNQVLYFFGVEPVPGALPAVLGGGFLFGAFFMATDPVSSPRTNEAKFFYAIIIGVFTTVIRNFSIFNGGLMFSILIGNMFAPILDTGVKAFKASRKAKKEGAAA